MLSCFSPKSWYFGSTTFWNWFHNTQKTMSLILRRPKHTPCSKNMSLILRQPKHTPHVFRNWQNHNIIHVGNCLIDFQEKHSRERLVAVWCFYAEKCSERSRVRISGGPKIIFQIKCTRDVKSIIRVVESKQKTIRRWSMTIFIDSTYHKRKICDMDFWVNPSK
jgi:hypothetical protein